MLRKTSIVLASLGLLVALAVCGPTRFAYAPVTTTSAEIVGQPAADHAFPPDSPQGSIRLATFGIAQLATNGPWVIHIRMSATNEGQEAWIIDKKEQLLDIVIGEDRNRISRVRSSTDTGETGDSPAQIEVPARTTRTLDLFFPMPPGARDATEVPGFDVVWTVRVGGRNVTMSTPFERFVASGPARNVPRAEPNYPYSGVRPDGRLPGEPNHRWPQPMPPVPVPPNGVPAPGPPSP